MTLTEIAAKNKRIPFELSGKTVGAIDGDTAGGRRHTTERHEEAGHFQATSYGLT